MVWAARSWRSRDETKHAVDEPRSVEIERGQLLRAEDRDTDAEFQEQQPAPAEENQGLPAQHHRLHKSMPSRGEASKPA